MHIFNKIFGRKSDESGRPDTSLNSQDEKISEQSKIKTIGDMDFIFISGGELYMGSPLNEEARDSWEDQHKVFLDGFWMGKFEATQAQWESITENNPSEFKGSDKPVECVSWNDVLDFIDRFNKKYEVTSRLPTEAEWEYAARAGTVTAYYWGDKLDVRYYQYAWYAGNSDETQSVGQKIPNKFGLYDMSGNVWEWCQDWFGKDYYSASPNRNPTGPSTGNNRVIRGGSYNSYRADYLRSACRSAGAPDDQLDSIGFRIVIPCL